MTKLELEAQALALELELMSFDELGMPYIPHQVVALFSIQLYLIQWASKPTVLYKE